MSVLSKGQITTGAVTFAIAIGVGHLTQYGFSGIKEFQQPAPRPSYQRPSRPDIGTSSIMMQSPLMPVEEITPESDLTLPTDPSEAKDSRDAAEVPLEPINVPADAGTVPPGQDQVRIEGFGATCDLHVAARSASNAMIQLDVLAPCDRGTEIAIGHGSLSFTSKTDSDGALSLEIPAFRPDAEVKVRIPGRATVITSARVPDAMWYDRVGLMWAGDDVLSIRSADVEAGDASGAEGAFLVHLGDATLENPQLAKVYSYPSGRTPEGGTVQLSVSAKVTAETCDRTIPVRSVQTARGKAPLSQQLSVAFPGCDATGQILVLKNMLEDLKIAQN